MGMDPGSGPGMTGALGGSLGFRQATSVRMGVLHQRSGVRSVLDRSFEFVQ